MLLGLLLAAAARPSLQAVQAEPSILSSLYGYDDCIGSVDNFDTQEEYLADLEARNCTVEAGRTNVVSHTRLIFACGDWLQRLRWLDGMPVVFSLPLQHSPAAGDFLVRLSDGREVTPDCVTLGPANERNELDTVLLLGQFGDGARDTVRPLEVAVVGEVSLVTDSGPVSARGLSYRGGEADMGYLTSGVRLVSAKLWDVASNSEDFRPPLWPLPSSVYPNDCAAVYPSTTHVVRATFSGGVTSDGVASVLPSNRNVFILSRKDTTPVPYLGLADLGQAGGVEAEDGYNYPQDGDNYLDICLDLGPPDEASLVLGAGSLHLEVLCDPGLELSLLYPPKGRPHGCSYQNVEMTASNINSDKLLMYWDASLV